MSYLKIQHDRHSVTFAHRNIGSKDIFLYQFFIENGEAKIYSIEHLEQGNKKGTSYKHREVYHDISNGGDGKIYNFQTNEYEEVEIPEDVLIYVKNYTKGFLINCI